MDLLIEDFGAASDGVTDDTAAWQAAMDHARPGDRITSRGLPRG